MSKYEGMKVGVQKEDGTMVKIKENAATVLGIDFAMRTLDLSSDELLNKFHTLDPESDEYDDWLCQEILRASEKVDNIPLSQYKLKWVSFLAALSGSYDAGSAVSDGLRKGIESCVAQIDDSVKIWVSAGGLESLEEVTGDVEWGETLPDMAGLGYGVLESEEGVLDEAETLVVLAELDHGAREVKSPLVVETKKELGVKALTMGDVRLYQLAKMCERDSEGLDMILVLHGDVNFWNCTNGLVMHEFLNQFELVRTLGEFTASNLYKSAPNKKNQVVTVWRQRVASGTTVIEFKDKVYFRSDSRLPETTIGGTGIKRDGLTGFLTATQNIKGADLEVYLANKAVSEASILAGSGYGFTREVRNGCEGWDVLVANGALFEKVGGTVLTEVDSVLDRLSSLLSIEGKMLLQNLEDGNKLLAVARQTYEIASSVGNLHEA